ncbi:hypothetical protein V6N12_057141 [Hibiscus sabdariffa]|uniref:Amine oxidase domain-containing protein n=1 Tax=Hibiscus sabdariffa TaxID=183260 RepID=A0ABR2AUZ2_9ROSI
MDPDSRSAVIIIGAGVSGISAAKVLAENGIADLLILEASDRIGGRIRKESFGGVSVELGAGWIAGVGGKAPNPVWEIAAKFGLRSCFSDYSNARYNIYDQSGKIFPSGIAADSYKKAVDSAIQRLRDQESNCVEDVPDGTESPLTPKTPIELAIDFILHDFEMAGKFHVTFSFICLDSKKSRVVRELQHSRNGVTVKTEDGCIYEANYVVLSASIGVLQSDLICFRPPLPRWKIEAIEKCDVMIYTKVFLKFPYKFWPCGPDKEFFIYAHERRGYYTFWQHMENAYPSSNILVVTLTNGESKRVEAQPDEETLKEAMGVLRDMFGSEIPTATDILVPRWWNNRFQRGSYSNYPIISDNQVLNDIKAPVGRIFFTGEHTSERFNGYVHGGYLSGIDTSKALLEEMGKNERETENTSFLREPLLAFTESDTVSGLQKYDVPTQLYLSGKLGISEAIL